MKRLRNAIVIEVYASLAAKIMLQRVMKKSRENWCKQHSSGGD